MSEIVIPVDREEIDSDSDTDDNAVPIYQPVVDVENQSIAKKEQVKYIVKVKPMHSENLNKTAKTKKYLLRTLKQSLEKIVHLKDIDGDNSCCGCCFLSNYTDTCRSISHSIVVILLFGLTYLALRFLMYNLPQHIYPYPTVDVTDSRALNLVLYGDSLMNIPYKFFDMGYYLNDDLETFYRHVNIYNEGNNGETIADISTRIGDVLAHNPHAVILQWDSDYSNRPLSVLQEKKEELEANYYDTLDNVVTQLVNAGVEYIAISGSTLLGEGSIFQPSFFAGKEEIIDDYLAINKAVAEKHNCTFINIHEEFKKYIPSTWHLSAFYMTLDGEHPNRHGSQIIAKIFSAHIQAWLRKRSIEDKLIMN